MEEQCVYPNKSNYTPAVGLMLNLLSVSFGDGYDISCSHRFICLLNVLRRVQTPIWGICNSTMVLNSILKRIKEYFTSSLVQIGRNNRLHCHVVATGVRWRMGTFCGVCSQFCPGEQPTTEGGRGRGRAKQKSLCFWQNIVIVLSERVFSLCK